jgi:hypothetical protein
MLRAVAVGISMGAEWVIMHNEVTAANVRWTCSVALLRTRFGSLLPTEQTDAKYVGTESRFASHEIKEIGSHGRRASSRTVTSHKSLLLPLDFQGSNVWYHQRKVSSPSWRGATRGDAGNYEAQRY